MIGPIALAGLSLTAWVVLLFGRAGFWRADQRLDLTTTIRESRAVTVMVPARDEEEVICDTLPTILEQDYAGPMTVIVVDDHSTDGTAEIIKRLSQKDPRLQLVQAGPLPPGWSGKVWAMAEGVRRAKDITPDADFYLLTDADIKHHPSAITSLVAKAAAEQADLVSVMVLLDKTGAWPRLLIPAFVFFFQKLYPFCRVNDPSSRIAAAAGGCILLRPSALDRIGGFERMRAAVIDDCTLARLVKDTGGRIWLGLSTQLRSIRSNRSLASIWRMVTRTAYSQLNYNPLVLAGTVAGVLILYLTPPLMLFGALLFGAPLLALLAAITLSAMAFTYLPTLRLYGEPPYRAFLLPLAAMIYVVMTIDSARLHIAGRGGAWKGRFAAAHRPGSD